MTTAYLTLDRVSKTFGPVKALDQISFEAGKGEFLSILGPSGCGKTTALRVIAGLEPLGGGRVMINGRDVSGLPVSKRNIGIVFQSYALFPNLTASKNIAYGLHGRLAEWKVQDKVEELMALVGLEGLGHKYPSQLSGGQQQRVALARAMALSPDLLLLDEPLSALDAKVRLRLRREIRALQQRLGVTTIMVTHDQEEALTMADRILVMDRGRLVQAGGPTRIYQRPATPFVASFIGTMNFFEQARKVDKGIYVTAGKYFTAGQENRDAPLAVGDRATLAIRPEDVRVAGLGGPETNRFSAVVRAMEYRGAFYRLEFSLQVEGLPRVRADVAGEIIRKLKLELDRPAHVIFPPERLLVYGRSVPRDFPGSGGTNRDGGTGEWRLHG
ncbi:MAG: ATP-binding cassette domain-containing protein [Desulfobacter sp.]|nr:MAG: ATP-binding cassette domain-containing protein [Desulfobacter sp.]